MRTLGPSPFKPWDILLRRILGPSPTVVTDTVTKMAPRMLNQKCVQKTRKCLCFIWCHIPGLMVECPKLKGWNVNQCKCWHEASKLRKCHPFFSRLIDGRVAVIQSIWFNGAHARTTQNDLPKKISINVHTGSPVPKL